MKKGKLFVVSAPSGGGKTSLTRAAVEHLAREKIPAAISISYTTRPPRPGEQDGVHYHFVDPAASVKILDGIAAYFQSRGIPSAAHFVGSLKESRQSTIFST